VAVVLPATSQAARLSASTSYATSKLHRKGTLVTNKRTHSSGMEEHTPITPMSAKQCHLLLRPTV